MTEIENQLKIPLQVYALDKNKKIFEKGIVYPMQSTLVDLTDTVLVRFLYKNCKMGDYAIGVTPVGTATEAAPVNLIKKCAPPKKIVIGQIIAKNQIVASGYMTWHDMPELRLHNFTNHPLLFNGNLVVPPRGSTEYKGREQSGIQTGFLLVNNDGIFRDFLIKHPVTDIYFGLVSDHQMPTYTKRYLI
jgi:hypothetical protein